MPEGATSPRRVLPKPTTLGRPCWKGLLQALPNLVARVQNCSSMFAFFGFLAFFHGLLDAGGLRKGVARAPGFAGDGWARTC